MGTRESHPTPRLKTLDAIAKALGISVSDLIVESEWHLQ